MVEGGVDVDALFERYGPMVLRRCRRLQGDEDEALDVTQEVFLRVRAWPPVRCPTSASARRS